MLLLNAFRTRLVMVLISSVLAACNAPTKTTPTENAPATDSAANTLSPQSVIDERIAAGMGIGLSVAEINADGVSYINSGTMDKTSGTQITSDSLFEIGSISKTFTTTLLADMILKGELDLDDPVQKFLPETVKMPKFEDQDITLRHLATHTSSLPRIPDNLNPSDLTNPYADYTPERLYTLLSAHLLEAPVGETYAYSNLGMGLLGHILELHSGKT